MNTEKLRKLFEASTDKYGDARKMGMTYQSILNILNGADPKVSSVEKIAKFYSVPVGYFFDEADTDGRPAHELEIESLKGQIKGMQDALDRLGFSMKGLIIEDFPMADKD